MPDWLDGWTNTRYLNQQALAKRWANRGTLIADEPPQVVPIEHSKYILTHGKKAYRAWMVHARARRNDAIETSAP